MEGHAPAGGYGSHGAHFATRQASENGAGDGDGTGAKEGTPRRKRKKTRRTSRRGVGRAKRAANDDAEAGAAHARAVSAPVDVIELSSEEEGEVRDDVPGMVAPRRRSEGNDGSEGGAGADPPTPKGSSDLGESSGLGESDDEPIVSPVLSARPSLQEAAHRVFSDDVGIGGGDTKGTAPPREAGVTRARASRRIAPGRGEPRGVQRGPRGVWADATGPATVTGPATRASRAVLKLLERRKLALVLDLDHTLLNSCMSTEMDEEPEASLLKFRLDHEKGLGPEGRTLHFVERLQIWTKLRPGVKKFLRQVASMFEVHVITMGTQSYADEMRQLIDPGRQHIKGSVIGLGQMDEFGELQPADKKRLDGELSGLDSIAVVLDDHVGVWPDHEENLIEIDRYLYFPSALKQFGVWRHGASLLEKKVDEIADRSTLAAAFEVLRRVHQDFFAERAGHLALANKKAKDAAMAELARGLDSESEDADNEAQEKPESTELETTPGRRDPQVPVTVPEILALEKKKVLAGIGLVFSGVFPLDAPPHEQKMWRLAEQFGARCETQPGPNTSHVVAKTWGTGKCQWAKENGRHVVSPDWLFCSAFLWSKADERAFNPPDHRK